MRYIVCTTELEIFNEGLEVKTIEETVSIINLENNHRKINTLEEIAILKAASSYKTCSMMSSLRRLLVCFS